jgi:hypothetical protein
VSEAKFGAWSVAESPVSIEYSLVVIEEIRHEVAEGFQRLSRGGIEVGGILYGAREGRTVRVLAMRPVACEHARGPAFLLSDKDRIALHEQLNQEKEDPQLEGLISVGWFLSHTRSEISLTESDLEIYTIFFPAPWQVTLVVRPGRGGTMRAGYFIREADGTVKNEKSYLEFNFPDRLAGVLDRPPDRPPRDRRKIQSFYRAEAEDGGAETVPEIGQANGQTAAPDTVRRDAGILGQGSFGQGSSPYAGPQLLPPVSPRRKWPWLIAWAAVVILLGALGVRYWMEMNAKEPITLAVVDHDGQLQIQWSHSAKLVMNALRGTLQISDGGESKTFALTKPMLASGNFTYVRKSGDVEASMTIESPDGARWQEASRYLGRPPAQPVVAAPPVDPAPATTDQTNEIEKLKRENARQAARIKQLERTFLILRSRGIDVPNQP